jgi:mono/diheme cytochrome c family protein
MKCACVLLLLLVFGGCAGTKPASLEPSAKTFGTAIVEVSGGKQAAAAGSTLEQPVIVQVNDAQGSAVTGAPVTMNGPAGTSFNPASGVTDSSGQFTTAVNLGEIAGHYQFAAVTRDASGKAIELKIDELALGYQQILGRQLATRYCARCHDPESTPERVSNMDNLTTKPHAFNEGDALNKLTDADLVSMITHGGGALNKSPEMPPYGYTLSKSDIQALVGYIRAIADPPYPEKGLVYAKN